MPRLGLSDSVVVVTGATSGIGLATARLLARIGARVVVASRTDEDIRETAKELEESYGRPALGHACDVSKPNEVASLFRAVDNWEQGPLRGVVMNAGYAWDADLWSRDVADYDPEEAMAAFRAVSRVDLDGARNVTIEAVRRIRQHKLGGSLVYVSSTPALTGYQGTPYTEAKAAVLGLMRDVARAYGRHQIRANAVALGNIETGYTQHLDAATREELAQEAALGRWGDPVDVARVITFFLGDHSRFVTGQTLVVDGGTVMR